MATLARHTIEVDEQIRDVSDEWPHVFVLGAGASRACCPDGDRNGQIVPVMSELVEALSLGEILTRHGVRVSGDDLETLYSNLADSPDHSDLRQELEHRILGYFSALRLPASPTLYDHLLLSLREKDVIATFN